MYQKTVGEREAQTSEVCKPYVHYLHIWVQIKCPAFSLSQRGEELNSVMARDRSASFTLSDERWIGAATHTVTVVTLKLWGI